MVHNHVCQLSSKKLGKPTAEDESLFTTTMLALALKSHIVLTFPNEIKNERSTFFYEAVDAFRMHVLEIPQSEWQKYFDNWYKCMQKRIDLNGEYF